MSETARPARRSRAWVGAGVALLLLVLAVMATGAPPVAVPFVLGAAAVTAGAVVLGAVLRTRQQRRAYEAELTAWAAREAVQAERLRIARDLHDLVSHGLGLITVRAASARIAKTPGGDAERVQALTDIEEASREATTELRRMLNLLRDGQHDGSAPLHPADRLDDLPAIVTDSRCYGVEAELRLGSLGQVTPGVQLAVCAIVREALTNAARHAGPTHVTVDVHRDGDAIAVSVRDRGAARDWVAAPGAGHGLAGLRERAENLGGTLLAEPTGTGFHLAARLPDRVSA